MSFSQVTPITSGVPKSFNIDTSTCMISEYFNFVITWYSDKDAHCRHLNLIKGKKRFSFKKIGIKSHRQSLAKYFDQIKHLRVKKTASNREKCFINSSVIWNQ